MIISILSIFLFLIFSILAGFHFYWLFGGVWGLDKVIPTKKDQLETITIPKFATLVVGLVLALFGLIYLVQSGFTNLHVPNMIANYGYWFVPSVFILRAIGEFKYVGFFKTIKNSQFSKADSTIFSPLCLGIGLIGILIQLIK